MSHTETRMDPARLQAIQDRRRSSAAGKHGDRRTRRNRTRATTRARAIGEHR